MNSVKHKIPKALREQVWLVKVGRVFEIKCKVSWCTNKMTVFDYQCGHNVPESKGGGTILDNLVPICSRCNVSMGNQYTIDEWDAKFAAPHRAWWRRIFAW
jgi:5-methylcytosine-specific restriction endonuclease McrA